MTMACAWNQEVGLLQRGVGGLEQQDYLTNIEEISHIIQLIFRLGLLSESEVRVALKIYRNTFSKERAHEPS